MLWYSMCMCCITALILLAIKFLTRCTVKLVCHCNHNCLKDYVCLFYLEVVNVSTIFCRNVPSFIVESHHVCRTFSGWCSWETTIDTYIRSCGIFDVWQLKVHHHIGAKFQEEMTIKQSYLLICRETNLYHLTENILVTSNFSCWSHLTKNPPIGQRSLRSW